MKQCNEQPAEIVPASIVQMADAIMAGAAITGGRRAGRTWAIRLATAKPAGSPRGRPARISIADDAEFFAGPLALPWSPNPQEP